MLKLASAQMTLKLTSSNNRWVGYPMRGRWRITFPGALSLAM